MARAVAVVAVAVAAVVVAVAAVTAAAAGATVTAVVGLLAAEFSQGADRKATQRRCMALITPPSPNAGSSVP
jgi:hypothetical protein